VPNSSTLDDLERPKRPLTEINKNSGVHQQNFNEDRSILSAAKCRPVIVVSKNVRYMHADIFRLLPHDATQSAVMILHVVCLSLTLRYDFHTCWNTSKIIARPNSLGSLLSLTPTWAVWSTGTPQNWGRIRVGSDEGQKSRDFPCFLTYDVSSH